MEFEYKDEYKYLSNACLNLTDACNLACKYCLTGDTLILLKDGTTLPIKDVKVGDSIIGVEENITKKYQRRTIFPTQVLKISQREVEEYLRITFSDGKELKITDEHPVLNGRGKWTQTKNLQEKTGQVMSLGYIPQFNDLSLLENIDYIKGYFLAMWITDGSFKHYRYYYENRGENEHYRLRLAVKDAEIIERMKKYCQILKFDYTIRDFLISEKDQLYTEAIFSSKKNNYDFIEELLKKVKNNKEKYLNNDNFVKGFLAATYDAEGHIDKQTYTLSISNSDSFILDFWEQGLKKLGFEVKRDEKACNTANKDVYRSRMLVSDFQIATGELQMKFFDIVKPAVTRKCFSTFYNSCSLYRNTINKIEKIQEKTIIYNLETQSHTYIANGLVVHNCFVAQSPHYMTLETAKAAVDYLINNLRIKKEKNYIPKEEQSLITFFGGEPFLLWDEIIVPLVEYTEKKYPYEISYNITTNGTLLSKERIDFLYNHNIGILLSIDGAKDTQDYNRPCHSGKSSFDLIIPNIPYLLEKFPEVIFRSTIYAPTVEHTFENYLFASYLGFKNIFMMPNCRDKWTNEQKEELKNQISYIYDFMKETFDQENIPISFSPINVSFENILKHDLKVYMKEPIETKVKRNVYRCGLGTSSGSIGYNGNIYGCQEQDSQEENSKFYIGNIFKKGIEEKLHIPLLKEYSKEAEAKCENEKYCEDCPIRNICISNACPSTTQDLFNSFFIDSEIHCFWHRTLFEESVKLMNILVLQNNETFKIYLDEFCNYNNYFGKGEE